MRYAHIAHAVFNRPWMILPETYNLIAEITAHRIAGERLTDEEIAERLAAAPQRPAPASSVPMVAVIPIRGVLIPFASELDEMSGATSTAAITSTLRSAMADEQVAAIVLDIDSPGGFVDGIPELAREIRQSRASKPIVSIARYQAASAAYYLASQATELLVAPSGEVGSIGVITPHQDISAMQEKLGVKTTLIYSGKYKTEGNPYEPLGEEARAYLQKQNDELYAMFVNDVAAGRGVSAAEVRENYGQGRMLLAKDAVSAGMADRVATIDDAISRAAKLGTQARRPRAAFDGIEFVAIGDTRAADDGVIGAEIAISDHVEVEGDPDSDVGVEIDVETPPDRPALAEVEIARARADARRHQQQ